MIALADRKGFAKTFTIILSAHPQVTYNLFPDPFKKSGGNLALNRGPDTPYTIYVFGGTKFRSAFGSPQNLSSPRNGKGKK